MSPAKRGERQNITPVAIPSNDRVIVVRALDQPDAAITDLAHEIAGKQVVDHLRSKDVAEAADHAPPPA